MNYGKTAYLKVLDLERRSLSQSSQSSGTNYIELTKQNLNITYTTSLPQLIEFNPINASSTQDLCFQIKAQIFSQNEGETIVKLLVDGSIISQESKTLTSGENEIIIFKTFTPLADQSMRIALQFESNEQLFSASIQNVYLVVLGATSTSTTNSIELRAVKIPNEDNVIISYIDSGNLYWTKTALTTKTLAFEDFSYFAPAISHCFCPSKINSEDTEEISINLFRVDLNKNLYYSTLQSTMSEQLIEKGVSVVHACPCPTSSEDTTLVTYIKNSKCYFRTLRGDVVVSEKSFSLPSGRYSDINAISHSDSNFVYVIATNSEGANYILRSLIEVSTGKIVEIIKADYLIALSKYVDLSFIKDKCIERINADAKIDLSVISYTEIMKRLCQESLNISYAVNPSAYDANATANTITYGVRLDKSITVATEWGSYTDDAETLLPAYTDFTTGEFIDNGWLSRWPFNQIKPCFIKDGEILGYLNPNDYSKFEDGTDAPITDPSIGFVMIEMPKIYYKLYRDDNYIDVKISNTMQDGFTCAPFIHKGFENDKIYIGAYLSGSEDYASAGFDSNSGRTLLSNGEPVFYHIHDYLYMYLSKNYNVLTLDALTLIQTLAIILFKTTDIQRVFSGGYNSSQASYTTGLLNDKGMYYGSDSLTEGTKLFGFEDLYSARRTAICGAYVAEDGTFYHADNTIDADYSPQGFASFIKTDKVFPLEVLALRIGDDIFGANETGFLFTKGEGTSNTKNFCDAFSISSAECFYHGGSSNGYYNGIFSIISKKALSADLRQAIRLMFFPNK